MVSIREIADDKTTISSTRWAFASVIKYDMIMILVAVILFTVAHLIGKPLDNSFFYSVATLLGILTGLVAAPKALQGFEPRKDKPTSTPTEKAPQVGEEKQSENP